MASNLAAVSRYRRVLAISAASLLVLALAGIATALARPEAQPLDHALRVSVLPAAALAGVVVLLSIATIAVRASLPQIPSSVVTEEPLLVRPRMPTIRRDGACITIIGVVPKSGASTLASSLAILVASEGRLPEDPAHRPRPLCLLNGVAGPDHLDLDPRALSGYLAAHPWTAEDELVDLASRHPSGAEFLSCGPSAINSTQLGQIVPMLRRHYNVIVIDAPTEDYWMTNAAMEVADAIVLVTLAAASQVQPAPRWFELIWSLGYEAKTILAVNRCRVSDRHLLRVGDPFLLELPDDPVIADCNVSGTSWVMGTSQAARQLRAAARTLLPVLIPNGGA